MSTNNDNARPEAEDGNVADPNDVAATANAAARAAASSAPPATELEALRTEHDKQREQLLRTAADFDNFRKRSRRDVEEARQRGKDDLIRELLPVFDNLERALQNVEGVDDLGSVVEGVRMVLKLFEDVSERIGLSRIPGMGQRFDPAVHEAIQQKETDDQPPGTVVAEIAPGYRFGDRLVRPAMVVVARKPTEPPKVDPNDSNATPAGPKSLSPADTTAPRSERPRSSAKPGSNANTNGSGSDGTGKSEADKTK